jgi:DNA-binding SARP family transcriptional activator/tetratricopeptide (TPR) repeat protein
VIDALWPDLAVERAAPRLHKAAHYARRALGEARSIVLSAETVCLFPDAEVEIDATRFERRAESAKDSRSAVFAVDGYPGELLPQDPYEPWTEAPRERLRLLYLQMLRLAGRWETLTRADPADEAAHLAFMRQLAAAGDRRAALRQFERLERGLRRELGVAPSPQALRLRDELLAAPSTGRAATAISLVGRETEQARLTAVLDSVRQGRGQVVFVGGPAGIGKTSLLSALDAAATAQRMRVGVGVAARIEGDWPYAPVLEALAYLCRHHPALLDGLGDPFRDEIERALSGRQFGWDREGAHQRLFVATAELVRLASAGAGALLIIDDAHDADEASLRLLHYLVRGAMTERLLLAVGHRPAAGTLEEVRNSLLAKGNGTVLDLPPLSAPAAAALARRHSPDADGRGVGRHLRGLGRRAVLGGSNSHDRPAGERTGRLVAGLPEPMLRALADAAVLGSAFDTDEFTSVTGLSDQDAYAVLDQRSIVVSCNRLPTGYAFRHALIRESVLATAGPEARRDAHERAARSPATAGAGLTGAIGHHLVRAGSSRRGRALAADHGRNRGGARGLSRCADDARGGAAPCRRRRSRAILLALRADLLNACGDLGAVEAYREALASTSDPGTRVRIRTQLARAATYAGDLDTARLAIAGLELDGGDNDAALLLARGNLAYFRHDFAAADEAAAEAHRRISLGAGGSWRLFSLIALQGLLAHHRGEWFQRLRTELRSGIRRPDLVAGIFDSHLCVAEFLLYGPTPYDDVIALGGELRETAERAGVLRAVAFAAALRGEAALLKGDLELAESELQAAADLHHDLESPAGEAHSLQRLAEVYLARGDRDSAARLLQRALPLARWSLIGLHLMHRVYGNMIDAAPDVEAARAIVDRAEATFADEDRCSFCQIMFAVPAARACADAGDLAEAHRYLKVAERSEALWEGTAWQASLVEIRAHIARAEHRDTEARRLFDNAADLFAAAGQPLDAQRCRA